jgi:hypothetical protein
VFLLCYVLDNRGSDFWFPVGETSFSSPLLTYRFCEIHPASYPISTGSSLPAVKVLVYDIIPDLHLVPKKQTAALPA